MTRHAGNAFALLVGTICLQSCQAARDAIGPSSIPPAATAASSQVPVPVNYRAHLSGREVVPPIETLAEGQAVFQLSRDGTELSYLVIASNIENVTSVHIHLGAFGLRGPQVAFFAPAPSGGGRTDGVLARGAITAAGLRGPLNGQPLSALISAIEAGNAYVDVPTNDGIAPVNTGPGDFNGGELRGQIR
jgi:hypothetical protein